MEVGGVVNLIQHISHWDVDLDKDLEYRITIKVADRIYVEEESLNLLDKENNKHLIFKTKRARNNDSEDILEEEANRIF